MYNNHASTLNIDTNIELMKVEDKIYMFIVFKLTIKTIIKY